MYEKTRLTPAREFCELARASEPSSLKAQEFFKEHVMGLKQGLPAPQKLSGEEKADIHGAYLQGLTKVLRTLTGAEFQTAAGYDTIIKMIPETEPGVRRALRNVAISCGIA